MFQQNAEKIKAEGVEIINGITQNLINIDTCKINFLYFWQFLKNKNNIEKYEKEYLNILKKVVAYNKNIDGLFPISLSQQYDTIYCIPIFNLQREQIQNLIHEFANNISSKKMQLNFLRSIGISILAIIIAIFSLIVNLIIKK